MRRNAVADDHSADALRHIDALLEERRSIEPFETFRAHALVSDPSIYDRAEADPEAFWAEEAGRLTWSKPWDQVVDWNPPWVKWFIGGKLNVAVNYLDRHAEATPDRVAYHWEGAPGDTRT